MINEQKNDSGSVSRGENKPVVVRSCIDCGHTFKTSGPEIYCPYCEDEMEREDVDEYRERMEEERLEELAERAAMCKCGAWQFAKDGSVVHVADCCCGAE